jgi:hypothetical protein
MDDRGVLQSRRPGVEFRAAGDSECQVVQAGARLVECFLTAVPVLREPQARLQAVVPEKNFAACPSGAVYSPARRKPSTSSYQAALASTSRTVSPKWWTPLIMPCSPLTARSSHPDSARGLQRAPQGEPCATPGQIGWLPAPPGGALVLFFPRDSRL